MEDNMKVLECKLVDVPQAAIAELPPELLSSALQRLVNDGHLLARNGAGPVLYRLQAVTISGAVITEAGAEPPPVLAAKTIKRRPTKRTKRAPGVKGCRWRKATPAQAKAIGAALRKRRGKASQPAFAKKLGVSVSTLSKYECGHLAYLSKQFGERLKGFGLGALIPEGGAR